MFSFSKNVQYLNSDEASENLNTGSCRMSLHQNCFFFFFFHPHEEIMQMDTHISSNNNRCDGDLGMKKKNPWRLDRVICKNNFEGIKK